MIALFKNGEVPNKILAQLGDEIRLPINATDLIQGQNYSLRVDKVVKKNCDLVIEERRNATISNFQCTIKGNFRIRVKSFDTTGEKQFAIFIGGKQLGRVFKKTATTINEYVLKIVSHFSKVNGWSVTNSGNIIEFQQTDECNNCGKILELRLGNLAKINTNKPCITKEYIGTETVNGSRCYILNFNDFVVGNKITINGLSYLVTENDTEETLRTFFYGEGNEYYCILDTDDIEVEIENGNRVVFNNNTPKLTATYDNSDATYDYYLVRSFDVRSGNIFKINDTEITANDTDTQSTIDTFFNFSGGFFRVLKGSEIAISTLSNYRMVANTNTPSVTNNVVSYKPTGLKDKWQINICADVVTGNDYYLNGLTYTAKPGDTNIDVAFGLYGSNSPTFFYYIGEDVTFEVWANNGYNLSSSNLADIELLNNSVACCSKNSLIFDFNAKELGCYQGVLMDQYKQDIFYTSIIQVDEMVEGEVVEFNNSFDAYGLEFDRLEWFKIRLPIFLNDWTPFTTEEINESISGKQSRGKTTIKKQRGFVTKPIDFTSHEFIMKFLKTENVKINGQSYTFFGEYELESKRNGKNDLRAASGILQENGNISSNIKNCKLGA